MKQKVQTIYTALKRLSMGSRGPDVLPGNVVDLSHCTPDEIEVLKTTGAVREETIPLDVPAVSVPPLLGATKEGDV